MTPDRWQQVKRILESVLERDPKDRAALLDEACQHDPSLRMEVESLIVSHEQAGSVFDSPAFEAAALLAEQRDNMIGRRIGHFKILSELGRGGMGEVFLAEDRRLGRRVALKLLPAFYTRDPDRLARFEMEARSASGLNHPNIVTIFDVGQIEGVDFIATEYVEGETLRAAMKHAMSLGEALELSSQVASALAAAHAAGIVHRDIKPENIMLRPDRYVKVLDFGLAKLTEQKLLAEAASAPMKAETDPGTIIGTAYYMSPEQARGLRVDPRTDIFSLGVVLYEMIAGRLPFGGDTASDVVASLLKTEPRPLAEYVPGLPSELQRIVGKALRKDREERYQSVRDMMVDLRSLKQELDIEAKLRPSQPPANGDIRTATTERGQLALGTGERLEVGTASGAAVATTSSAEIIISEIKRHKAGASIVLLTLILVIAAVAFGLLKLIGPGKSARPFETMQLAPITSSGKAAESAISPDGKYVAYSIQDEGRQSLWLKQTATGSNVQLLPPATATRYRGLSFSPDGNYLYYLQRATENPRATLYQIPALGGEPRKLVEDISTDNVPANFCFAPDGKQIAFVRTEDITRSLLVMNVDGSGERKLLTAEPAAKGEYVAGAAWSPDGKTIVCAKGIFGGSVSLLTVSVADYTVKPVSAETWTRVNAFSWLPDGRGLVIAATRSFGRLQLWHIAYPSGESHRITNDLHSYGPVSLTADASTLVTVQENAPTYLLVGAAAEPGRAQRVSPESDDYDSLCWTPDGRILYDSTTSGNYDIWSIKADGSGKRRLAEDASFPSVPLDGSGIYFMSRRGADRTGQTVWRMDSDGGNATQLLTGSALAVCSPDGKWVVYASRASGRSTFLWKWPIAGGDSVRLTDKNAVEYPAVSPDGQWIACNYFVTGPGAHFRIAIIPFAGGEPSKIFDVPGFAVRELRWTPDSRAITYLDARRGVSNGVPNIWAQPIDGGAAKQLTDFQDGFTASWNWSPDGKQFAVSRGTRSSDVVLITNLN